MATLSLSQGSLTLLFLSVVTFKKILFPMFCDVLQNELRQRGLLKLRCESQAPKPPTSPCCWSVSAGRRRAARRRPEEGPSRSPSPSRRCRSAGRSTPTTRRTPTSSASTPTMSLTSSRKILLAGGREDYEGNKVCFPTITSPRFKRLSKNN